MKSWFLRVFSWSTLNFVIAFSFFLMVLAYWFSWFEGYQIGVWIKDSITYKWLTEVLVGGVITIWYSLRLFNFIRCGSQKERIVRVIDDTRIAPISDILRGKEDSNTRLYPDVAALCAYIYIYEKKLSSSYFLDEYHVDIQSNKK